MRLKDAESEFRRLEVERFIEEHRSASRGQGAKARRSRSSGVSYDVLRMLKAIFELTQMNGRLTSTSTEVALIAYGLLILFLRKSYAAGIRF
jgi:hypothetical protein